MNGSQYHGSWRDDRRGTFLQKTFLLHNAPLQQLLLATGGGGLYYRDARTGGRVGHVSAKLINPHFLLCRIACFLLFSPKPHARHCYTRFQNRIIIWQPHHTNREVSSMVCACRWERKRKKEGKRKNGNIYSGSGTCSHICPYLASDHSPSVSVNHESAEHNQSVDQTLHRRTGSSYVRAVSILERLVNQEVHTLPTHIQSGAVA